MTNSATLQTIPTTSSIEEARLAMVAAVEADDSAEFVVWHQVYSRLQRMADTGCTWREAANPWAGSEPR